MSFSEASRINSLAASSRDAMTDFAGRTKAAADDAMGRAGEALSEGQKRSSELAGGVAQTLRDGAEAQKNAGASAVASLARSAREAAENLEGSAPEAARLVRSSADAVERLSTRLKDQSLSDIAASVASLARRQPLLAIGGGVVAGIVLGRLLASSNR